MVQLEDHVQRDCKFCRRKEKKDNSRKHLSREYMKRMRIRQLLESSYRMELEWHGIVINFRLNSTDQNMYSGGHTGTS